MYFTNFTFRTALFDISYIKYVTLKKWPFSPKTRLLAPTQLLGSPEYAFAHRCRVGQRLNRVLGCALDIC